MGAPERRGNPIPDSVVQGCRRHELGAHDTVRVHRFLVEDRDNRPEVHEPVAIGQERQQPADLRAQLGERLNESIHDRTLVGRGNRCVREHTRELVVRRDEPREL